MRLFVEEGDRRHLRRPSGLRFRNVRSLRRGNDRQVLKLGIVRQNMRMDRSTCLQAVYDRNEVLRVRPLVNPFRRDVEVVPGLQCALIRGILALLVIAIFLPGHLVRLFHHV